MFGYLEKEIHAAMAQGRSTKNVSMIRWIWTSMLSTKNALSVEAAKPQIINPNAVLFEV